MPHNAEREVAVEDDLSNRREIIDESEFDTRRRLPTHQIADGDNADRRLWRRSNPLPFCLRPGFERRGVEPVLVQSAATNAFRPFNRRDLHTPSSCLHQCLELLELLTGVGPNRYTRTVAREPVERCSGRINRPHSGARRRIRAGHVRCEQRDARVLAVMQKGFRHLGFDSPTHLDTLPSTSHRPQHNRLCQAESSAIGVKSANDNDAMCRNLRKLVHCACVASFVVIGLCGEPAGMHRVYECQTSSRQDEDSKTHSHHFGPTSPKFPLAQYTTPCGSSWAAWGRTARRVTIEPTQVVGEVSEE